MLILNTLSNKLFLPIQLNGKSKREGNWWVKIRANFFEIILIFLLFKLINLCFLGIGIYKDDQDTIFIEEVEDLDVSIAIEDLNISTTDIDRI